MKVATVFKYTSAQSAYKDSRIDLSLGFANNQAGSGRSITAIPCLAIVADDHGNGYVALIKSVTDPAEAIWNKVDPTAPQWKYVYDAIPVTPVMPIPTPELYPNVHPQWMKTEDRLELAKKMLTIRKINGDELENAFAIELK